MDKKIYFFIFGSLAVVIVGGIFLWSEYAKNADNITPAVRFEPPENYVIKDTADGKIVENKNAGLSFKVPDGWSVEKKEAGTDAWMINLLSSDGKISEQDLLQTGCGIAVWIEYDETIAGQIRDYMKKPQAMSGKFFEYKVIPIDNQEALRRITEFSDVGTGITIQLPHETKIFSFETLLLRQEKERCSKEFDDFIKGISIQQ